MDNKNYEYQIKHFESAISFLSDKLRFALCKIPPKIKQNAQEIRIRVNRNISVICPNNTLFVSNSGDVSSNAYGTQNIKVYQRDIEISFCKLCDDSVYSFQNQISNGFVTAKGGHRVGICGTAVVQNSKVVNIKDISSLNIRIAKDHFGCAKPILDFFNRNQIKNTLIIGPPSSGKTSLLRDLARELSLMDLGGVKPKIVIVDERNEIAATHKGIPQFDIGLSDVLSEFSKSDGIIQAVRSLSPDVVICDEIGTESDLESIIKCINCGAKIVASIHAENKEDFRKKNISEKLIDICGFENLVFLKSSSSPGAIQDFIKSDELKL